MHQNGIRMLHRVELVNRGPGPLEGPELELSLQPGGLAPRLRPLARLESQVPYILDDLDLTVDPQRLVALVETERALLRILVRSRDGTELGRRDEPVELLT